MKKKLWLDFDNTIADTATAFLKTYNVIFENTGKEDTLCWNFDDANVVKEYIPQVFESGLFFQNLKPYPNAIETIKELAQMTDTIICTIGTWKNIKAKITWLEWYKLEKYVGILPIVKPPHQPTVMNKSIIQDGIHIDDHPNCLKTGNAEDKVLFSWQDKPYDWQQGYIPQHKMTTWDNESFKMLEKLIKGE